MSASHPEDRSGRPIWLLVAFVGVSGMFIGQLLSRPAPSSAPMAAPASAAPVTSTAPADRPTLQVADNHARGASEAMLAQRSRTQEEVFQLADAVIQSLALANAAKGHLRLNGDQKLIPLSALLDAIQELQRAESQVALFASAADDSDVRQVATAFANAYETIRARVKEVVRAEQKMLTAFGRDTDFTEGVIELTELPEELERAWRLLGPATIALVKVVKDPDRQENGRPCCLRITAQQRTILVQSIDDAFGYFDINQATQNPTLASAGLLRIFLTADGWKTADVPD